MTEPSPGARRGMPLLRWWIVGGLFLLSVLNYVDRQALAILAETIQRDLSLSDVEYGRVAQVFLACYACAYLAVGRAVDRVGPRLAETAFVAWWSLANVFTGFASGFSSLALFRGLLGLGEPGHYAVSAKVVGRWFPAHEKGLAVGLYTMGGTLGAALAAPLVAFLAIGYGWRAAFVVTGAAGLVCALAWWLLYRDPAAHPLLGEREAEHLKRHGLMDAAQAARKPVALRTLFGWRAVWVIVAARMLTDPVWYFYLVWFAKYLQAVRAFTLAEVGATLWVVFVAADVGCLLSGFLAARQIRRGRAPVVARLRVMTGAAGVLALGFLVPLSPTGAWALAAASCAACATLVFLTSAVALPLDLFPPSSLGSVQGVIGTGGSVGGVISTGLVASAVTHLSYDHAFVAMCALHPLAIVLLWLFLPREPVPTPQP